MTIWHPLATNPIDHVGKAMSGEYGVKITLSQDMVGDFTADIIGPFVPRRFEGLSNTDACALLTKWNILAKR